MHRRRKRGIPFMEGSAPRAGRVAFQAGPDRLALNDYFVVFRAAGRKQRQLKQSAKFKSALGEQWPLHDNSFLLREAVEFDDFAAQPPQYVPIGKCLVFTQIRAQAALPAE